MCIAYGLSNRSSVLHHTLKCIHNSELEFETCMESGCTSESERGESGRGAERGGGEVERGGESESEGRSKGRSKGEGRESIDMELNGRQCDQFRKIIFSPWKLVGVGGRFISAETCDYFSSESVR